MRSTIGYIAALLLLGCGLSSFQPMHSIAAEQVQYTAWLSSGEDLSEHKNRFSIYDKVYLIIRLQELAPGEYTINSDWINPEGKLEQHNAHTFYLKKQSDYTYYAWVSLLKNGPLKRILTGSDINREFQGNWQTQVFLNDQKITSLTFDMF